MRFETGADSQQEFIDMLSWPRRLAEVHTTQIADGDNLATRHIDVIEVQVALGREHNPPLRLSLPVSS